MSGDPRDYCLVLFSKARKIREMVDLYRPDIAAELLEIAREWEAYATELDRRSQASPLFDGAAGQAEA